MLLEAQFGSNIAPIERPRRTSQSTKSESPASDEDSDEDEDAELARLYALGIPVPGIEIRVDQHVARVWLETLEVESSYPVLRDRVRVVVERAVETVADLWSSTAAMGIKMRKGSGGGGTNGAAKNGISEDVKMAEAKA
jgi:cleavage and polyadenylation specificity factor subunit 3